MARPSEMLATLAQTNGVGTLGDTSDWGIFVGKRPDQPARCITFYDAGGSAPNPKWLLDFPSVQVRVRGNPLDDDAAYDKAKEVKQALLGAWEQEILGDLLVSVTMQSDIASIGIDNLNRPEYVVNFSLIIEPARGADYRFPLDQPDSSFTAEFDTSFY